MRSTEASGKTVEEAIAIGLDELGLSIADVLIEVLDHGQKGLFGFGSKSARIRMTEIVAEEALMPKEMRPILSPIPVPKQEGPTKKQEPQRMADPVVPPVARDAEYAEEFLNQLLRCMDVRADAVLEPNDDAIALSMDGEDVAVLIGHRGETLDAIQYITSLVVNRRAGERVRVRVDAAGYRTRREESLVRLAQRSADRALRTGRRIAMEPMNPYERRIMHTALQDVRGVATHSEGEEPYRRIIIIPEEMGAPRR